MHNCNNVFGTVGAETLLGRRQKPHVTFRDATRGGDASDGRLPDQRFIINLVPSNAIQEMIAGDVSKLPSSNYVAVAQLSYCLLYTSDAADDTPCVDL
eukprot:376812-Amphidinium_carterae.1